VARGPGDRLRLSALTGVEVPDRIELQPGQVGSIRLPGLGSAGYRWSFEASGDPGVVEASMASAPPPFPPDGPTGGPPPTNYSVDTIVTLRALAAGRAKLRFVQRQPWAPEETPMAEHVLEVVVREAAGSD
jgi:hypothetical protein